VWECSRDLSEYLTNEVNGSTSTIATMLRCHADSISVSELGCGRALPSISLLSALDIIGFRGKINLMLQDLGADTIDSVTRPSVEEGISRLSADFRSRVFFDFVADAWAYMEIPPNSFHIVLSSECIYREDLFDPHASIINRMLRSDGVAILAAKRYYFGCGGGTIEFTEYLNKVFSDLQVDLESTFENGMSNTREIISIRRRESLS